MTHPEIPKDHPRFTTGLGFSNERRLCWNYAVTIKGGGGQDRKALHELTPLERQDAAAHAAAWWFEKAIALFLNDGFEDDQEAQKCVAIGRAWLAWGAQK